MKRLSKYFSTFFNIRFSAEHCTKHAASPHRHTQSWCCCCTDRKQQVGVLRLRSDSRVMMRTHSASSSASSGLPVFSASAPSSPVGCLNVDIDTVMNIETLFSVF